jgi:hypothetical protein
MRFRLRFGLRTLLVLLTLSALPMAWSAYQLDWIRQRREFLEKYRPPREWWDDSMVMQPRPFKACPWSLRLFGEISRSEIDVAGASVDEAHRLFPEAFVIVWTKNGYSFSPPKD